MSLARRQYVARTSNLNDDARKIRTRCIGKGSSLTHRVSIPESHPVILVKRSLRRFGQLPLGNLRRENVFLDDGVDAPVAVDYLRQIAEVAVIHR